MKMKNQAQGVDRVEEAGRACAELREALTGVGVQLPSLGLDPVSCSGSAPLGLIELGRCNIATARALAAVLRPRETAR